MRPLVGTLLRCLAVALCALAAAAQGDGAVTLELRVTSALPGSAMVDRGERDGLAVGDRVSLFPREGGTQEGEVVEVDERSALIELRDLSFVPSPGTRGEVRIPRERLGPAAPPEDHDELLPPPAADQDPAPPAAPQAESPPAHPPWEGPDDEWRQGDPLLARVRPLDPSERGPVLSGRTYLIADLLGSTEDQRIDGFYRVGGSGLYENLWGRGERLHLDGEINYRHTDVPDDYDDQSIARLRIDRASYAWGGTRFAPVQQELGRFLQQGMPEFGALDGYEWGTRTIDGDRYGWSVGFMPEPDQDYESFQDLQLAAYYRWILDESEELSAAAGFQKTFHDGAADRDLVVANLGYWPADAWTLHGTAWIDYYGSSDDAKGQGIELTQLYVHAGRRYEDGGDLGIVLSHIAFPEIERDEFLPVTDEQLADDHSERLSLHGRRPLGDDTALHGAVGGWLDEDESGGDLEFGCEREDWVLDATRFDLTAFGSLGRFSSDFGARCSLSASTATGGWRIDYEFADHQLDGFAAGNDELPQHRLRAARDFVTQSGWSLSGHVEAGLWDSETSFAAGIYMQRSL